MKYPNRYPGHCRYCRAYVGTGSGLIERSGSVWLVEHAQCAERYSKAAKPAASATPTANPGKARKRKGKPVEPAACMGVSDPLPVSRDPAVIRWHLYSMASIEETFPENFSA